MKNKISNYFIGWSVNSIIALFLVCLYLVHSFVSIWQKVSCLLSVLYRFPCLEPMEESVCSKVLKMGLIIPTFSIADSKVENPRRFHLLYPLHIKPWGLKEYPSWIMHNIIATTITDAAVQYDGNGVAQKKKTACISNCKTWDRTSVKNGNSSKFHSVPSSKTWTSHI